MRAAVLPLALAVLACTPSSTPTPTPAAAPSPSPSAVPEPAAPVTKPPAPSPTCLLRLEIDSDRCVLAEQRRRGGAARWDDFPRRYPARYLDPDQDHPVEHVARYQIGATPLLWFTPDYTEAVVNAAVLSDLQIVDATRLRVDERVAIGSLTELGQGALTGRELARFLIEAGVVQTFAHIGAQLCLIEERDDERGYQARFIGEHEYYTSERNLDPLGFTLVLAADGAIAAIGTEALTMPAPTP